MVSYNCALDIDTALLVVTTVVQHRAYGLGGVSPLGMSLKRYFTTLTGHVRSWPFSGAPPLLKDELAADQGLRLHALRPRGRGLCATAPKTYEFSYSSKSYGRWLSLILSVVLQLLAGRD